jgi:hypothetical protein
MATKGSGVMRQEGRLLFGRLEHHDLKRVSSQIRRRNSDQSAGPWGRPCVGSRCPDQRNAGISQWIERLACLRSSRYSDMVLW